jgi:hypothetical protein
MFQILRYLFVVLIPTHHISSDPPWNIFPQTQSTASLVQTSNYDSNAAGDFHIMLQSRVNKTLEPEFLIHSK